MSKHAKSFLFRILVNDSLQLGIGSNFVTRMNDETSRKTDRDVSILAGF